MPDLIPPTPPTDGTYEDNFIEEDASVETATLTEAPTETAPVVPPRVTIADAPPAPPVAAPVKDDMADRLERLGGEPAPIITPEDFARLQNAGQVHIDAQGRVRTARRTAQADAGVTLRKRRAWYSNPLE